MNKYTHRNDTVFITLNTENTFCTKQQYLNHTAGNIKIVKDKKNNHRTYYTRGRKLKIDTQYKNYPL